MERNADFGAEGKTLTTDREKMKSERREDPKQNENEDEEEEEEEEEEKRWHSFKDNHSII